MPTNKLPSFTLRQVWALTISYHPLASKDFFKKMFPGKRYISARDILRVPAKKFKSKNSIRAGGFTKSVIARRLMPVPLRVEWDHCGHIHGSSTGVKIGLELCDQYERGEI